MAFPEDFIRNFQDRFKGLTGEVKRRIVLISTGVFIVILVLSVLLTLGGSGKQEDTEEVNQYVRIAIPSDEIFLPDEPDFIPGVLLERERRLIWTEADAEEYWQDPLKYGEEQWRVKIETAIDEFLERIP